VESSETFSRSVRFGVFDVDLQSEELRKHGRKVRLPHQSFLVLATLLNRPGEIVTRDELRRLLWAGDTFVDFDMGLSSTVSKLRDALGDSADNPRFIETVPRRGYRFIAPTQPSSTTALAPPTTTDSRGAGGSSRGRRVLLLVIGVGLLSLPLWMLVNWRRTVGPAAPSIRSLAILPLDNFTGDPTQDYFVDGMTEALITELAQIETIRVISRSSVMRFKGTKEPLQAIASKLEVEGVVQGTVARSGRRVRVTAQLIDAASDRVLWANSYERDVDDVIALQGEITRAIATAIVGKLEPLQQARLTGQRVSAEANDLYLKGARAAARGAVGMKEAIAFEERAIALQPDFARAYAAMSLWYLQFAFGDFSSPEEYMPKAEAAARKALELDETLSEAHTDLGLVLYRYHWDWPSAEREFRRSLQLSPNYANGRRVLAVFLSDSGRPTEGVAEARRAREIDPLTVNMTENLAGALDAAGRLDDAIAEFLHALQQSPATARLHAELGDLLVAKGRVQDGIGELEAALRLQNHPNFRSDLGYAHAVAGNTRKAREIADELEASSRQKYVSPVGLAAIHEALGERETAIALLERAFQLHDFELTRLMVDRRLATLRSDPRFQDLVRRVGLAR